MKTIVKDFIIDDHVFIGRKRIALNMNIYRNLHYQTSNKAKIIFMNNLLNNYPELKRIKANAVSISYAIIRCNNRTFDIINIISIVDKFFLDSLVNIGCIPDDNYKIVSYDSISILKKETKSKNNQILIICKFIKDEVIK